MGASSGCTRASQRIKVPGIVVRDGALRPYIFRLDPQLELKYDVRLFLDRYLSFSPDSVNRNWADGLNMMTTNLRRATLATIEKNNVVGKIQDENEILAKKHEAR